MKRILNKHSLRNIININKISTVGYWELPPDFKIEKEHFDTWKLSYVDTGEVTSITGKKALQIKPGGLLLNKPNEIHDLRVNNIPTNLFVMTFVCHSPLMNLLHNKVLNLNSHQKKLISWLLKESESFFNDNDDESSHKETSPYNREFLGNGQLIRIHLEHLLILLARDNQQTYLHLPGDTDKFSNEFVKQLIHFLEENICNNITLEEVCKKFNYGNTYVCTTFKEETGYSIMNYYTKIKIDLSKKILREGTMNITQLSDYIGFCNPHYFSYVFKKYVHMSPREYQQSLQSQLSSVKVKRS